MQPPLNWLKQPVLKKNKLVKEAQASIENLSHDGRGIAHLNGKTTFVDGALPGEKVQFKYLHQRGSFDEGQVTAINHPSPWRVTALCPHYGVCGGCSLQHLNITNQIQHKQQVFQELLLRQAKLQPQEWLPAISSPAWGYRRKARLGVKYVAKKNRVLIGFREQGGRLITDSQQCEVLHPSIGQKIEHFCLLIGKLSIGDKIPQLEIAVGDHQSAVVIRHLQEFNREDLALIEKFGNEHQLQIYLQPGGTESVRLFYPDGGPALSYRLPRYDLTFEFNPLQFIQINATVNQAMVDRAIELLTLKSQEQVLDLFCGIGNFSLALARSGVKVVGVEGEQTAVQQAKYNARLNKISECEFYCSDLFNSSLLSAPWAEQRYDKILLYSPRSGAEQVIASLQRWQPQRLVYVSCDLATLARDALALHQQGYQLTKAGIMDMFPHTRHVEAIALFERKKNK